MKPHQKSWNKAKFVTTSHHTWIHKISDPSHKKKKPFKWLALLANSQELSLISPERINSIHTHHFSIKHLPAIIAIILAL